MIDLFHEKYMKLCLKYAMKGAGKVSPNPMVGAVLVKNGKIIGSGYHQFFGGPHAEVNAIKSATTDVKGADLYVNLEPCSHYGKTPPCVDLLIEKRIKRVIIATRDPNPLVNGKGVNKLKSAGIEVVENVLADDAVKLNEVFFKNMEKKIPFIAIKIAQTLDSKIADFRKRSKWITSEYSRKIVHKLRTKYDAVMVGANTVLIDNPELTTRLIKGRNPIRVVIDGKLKLSPEFKIFRDSKKQKTIIFTTHSSFKSKKQKIQQFKSIGVDIIPTRSDHNMLKIQNVLQKLYSMNIASVLVEGGQNLITEFLTEKLADRAYIFISPKIFGSGLSSISDKLSRTINNPIELEDIEIKKINNDVLIQGIIKY